MSYNIEDFKQDVGTNEGHHFACLLLGLLGPGGLTQLADFVDSAASPSALRAYADSMDEEPLSTTLATLDLSTEASRQELFLALTLGYGTIKNLYKDQDEALKVSLTNVARGWVDVNDDVDDAVELQVIVHETVNDVSGWDNKDKLNAVTEMLFRATDISNESQDDKMVVLEDGSWINDVAEFVLNLALLAAMSRIPALKLVKGLKSLRGVSYIQRKLGRDRNFYRPKRIN
jgi:hypothetical protein